MEVMGENMYKKITIILIFSFFAVVNLSWGEEIRNPAVEGSFYPSHEGMLRKMVGGFIRKASIESSSGKVVGLIVPHAGYVYSGKIAGIGYKQIKGQQYDTVILIGPTHKSGFSGFSVGNFDAYSTLLGKLQVDRKLAKRLIKKYKSVKFLPSVHKKEHSLEVQLPFLQMVLKEFKILPIVVGRYNLGNCEKLAQILYQISKNKKVFFVISTDFSHYHSYKKAKKIDKRTIEGIKTGNPKKFYKGVQKGKYELCGSGPVTIFLYLSKKINNCELKFLSYSNSGEVPMGNKSKVVGYSSFALLKEKNKQKTNLQNQSYEKLTKKEKEKVLEIAQKTLRSYVNKQKIPKFDINYSKYPHLREKRGVFVTLYKNDRLRGCIGRHRSSTPLSELVPQMVVASAFKDRRFPEVKKSELKDIKLEISVYLTDLIKINDIKKYKVGKHGIILRKGFNGATFLPKVPIEQGWNKETTLRQLCRKAGLSSICWKQASFYIYSTQVIKEK